MRRQDFDHTVPPPDFRLPPEAWQAIDLDEQRFITRRRSELLSGVAIYKDRMMGRPKKCEGGFHALHLLEQRLHYLKGDKGRGRLRDEIAALKHKLQDDEKSIEDIIKQSEEMEPFRQHAAAQGMTVSEYITKCRNIELVLYQAAAAHEAGNIKQCMNEVFDAICQIGEWLGFDPLEVLLKAANTPDPRVAH